jgi:pimeloyl-ACP methyl ester carboxylesterase
MREAHPSLEPTTIDHLVEHAVIESGDGGWRWKYDNAARLRAPDDADGSDLDACLAAIECPVLLCYGDASWIPQPPPDRLSLLRDHHVVTFPDVGHWLHHEARSAFFEQLSHFLSATTERVHHA